MDKVHSINSDVPLISVVAPVYKVEPFLQECIDSVLNQSFKDFELILVDDGSPDKCGEICDKATEKDSRIRVFHQENGGVSSARKLGVENAKGEWICFVDPDDRLPFNALQDLITACDTLGYNIDDFDVIEGGNTCFKVNPHTGKEKLLKGWGNVEEHKKRGIVIMQSLDYAKEIASHSHFFIGTPWGKIIRRSLLIETDALNIPKEFFQGQDNMSCIKMAKKLRKALRMQKIVYNYRQNPLGTARSTRERHCSFSYVSSKWNMTKKIVQDMPEEWLEVYKILVVKLFWGSFVGKKGKTWKLRSPEFAPYLSILYEKKDLLPTATKTCLLSTRFPFTLIPERLFYAIFFGTKFFVMLPIRVVRKLWRIIMQR